MENEFEFAGQKLGVLIDSTIQSNTINWIHSLSADLVLKQAAVEIPSQQPELNNLINRLLTGEVDLIVFFSSFGWDFFWQRAIRVADQTRLIHALSDIKTVVGNQQVLEKQAGLGIEASVTPFEDWRELLVYLDQKLPVSNLTVAIESTSEIHGVAAGIEARGGAVVKIPAIEFERKDPSANEQDLIDSIEDGDLGTILLPNPMCAARFDYLVQKRRLPAFQKNVDQLIIMALGSDTQDVLRESQISCDIVLSENQLQKEIQQSVESIRVVKERTQEQMSNPGSAFNDTSAPWFNNPFMKAIRLEPVEVTPIWMMRQAGRYMQEYREVREKVPFLELCKRPQLCSEVMCTAVEKLGVDAAIIFSDLLPILEPMGCHLEYMVGDGPVIHNPIRTHKDIDRIKPLQNNDELQFVIETVRQTRLDLPADMPLIGFAGAPFSLASYMIEGKSNRHYAHTKKIMFGDSAAWDELMSKLTDSIIIYLTGQIKAGAQCVQLFDSWAGCLAVSHYEKFVAQYVHRIIDAISPLAPVINFATGNPALLSQLSATRAQVIGVDWRIDLDDALGTIGPNKAFQGNLDPTILLSDPSQIRTMAQDVLNRAGNRPGHIFNLGHGILPQTPVENAIALVEIVKELSAR